MEEKIAKKSKVVKIFRVGVFFAIAIAIALSMGYYRSMLALAESVSLPLNFPSGWAQSSAGDMPGYRNAMGHGSAMGHGNAMGRGSTMSQGNAMSRGGAMGRGNAMSRGGAAGRGGPVTINIAKTGILKRLIQPNVVHMMSHRIVNNDKRPHKIKLELVGNNNNYTVRWESTRKDWNEASKTFERMVMPGGSVNMAWDFIIPRKMLEQNVIFDGGIAVIDAQTNQRLSYLPVKIINTDASSSGKDECCAP